MKKLQNRLKYFNLSDIFAPFIFFILLFPSLILKFILKMKNKQIWLICEDGITARDNGYHFFKYIMDKNLENDCYYVIKKKSSDYSKLIDYKDKVIEFRSLKHWLYYMSASKNISIHKHGNPCQSFFYIIHVVLKLYNNRIFLQHGVTKDDIPFIHYKNARFRLFICAAEREYNFVRQTFGYPDGYVVNTGFARFDNLHDNNINPKQILLMPTWRNWFGGNSKFDKNPELFIDTPFYKNWNSLLNDNELIKYIENNNIKIYFYPHQHMQKFLKYFKSKSESIKIIDNSNIDIQILLKESKLLITDYSSVFMDFGYMNKPVIYFQFDRVEFRKNHLSKGYFDYDKDGFGPVLVKKDDIINEIKNVMENEVTKEDIYYIRRKDFFSVRDKKNCERIYESIKKLD